MDLAAELLLAAPKARTETPAEFEGVLCTLQLALSTVGYGKCLWFC